MVFAIASRISFQVKRPFIMASTTAPTAPIAPASVGVARPMTSCSICGTSAVRSRKIRACSA